jgi:hypothetical protein
VCSNHAATRVNLLKCWEMRRRRNAAICRNSASSGNVQQTIALPSHGRGRWFDPSIAHSQKALFAGKTLSKGEHHVQLIASLCSSRDPLQVEHRLPGLFYRNTYHVLVVHIHLLGPRTVYRGVPSPTAVPERVLRRSRKQSSGASPLERIRSMGSRCPGSPGSPPR